MTKTHIAFLVLSLVIILVGRWSFLVESYEAATPGAVAAGRVIGLYAGAVVGVFWLALVASFSIVTLNALIQRRSIGDGLREDILAVFSGAAILMSVLFLTGN